MNANVSRGLIVALLAASPAAAGEPAVVELYTSQGCAACPPADALLAELAEREDVIALGLHVDYWDHLGWTDGFALAPNVTRQRRHAARLGEAMVFTPQMVIGGARSLVGSRREEVMQALARESAQDYPARVALSGDARSLKIVVEGPAEREGRVLLASWSGPERVEVAAGENEGRALTYANVVRLWTELGEWRGGRAEFEAPAPMDAAGAAALVEDPETGRILGAARWTP